MAGVLALALPALCWTISLRVRDSAVAEVSPSFIGSTLDVGVAYDLDSVKSAPYDLSPPQLVRLARGLSPGFLRIGGSTQDKLRYEPPQGGGCAPYAPPPYPCAQEGGTACLTLKRWRELHAFAADANLSLIFGLNACTGRPARDQPMDLTQTLQLLNYTARHGLPVYAFELGNELDGSYHGSDGVAPSALAADLSRLAAALRAFWPDAKSRPRLLAPDVVVYTGSVGMNPYFEAMLDSAARDEELGSFEGISSALNATKSPPISSSLSGITFHQYPYCDRPDEGAGTILDLHCLGKLSQAADEMSALGARHGVKAYAGEGSNCWTGGVANVSDVFLDTFYYSLQARENPAHLSVMATAGVQAVIRQTLLGNTYQLINSTTLTPNPSYWLVYLWRRLVGHRALAFSTDAPLPAPLRASVHCTPAAEEDVAEAGNARNTSATAVVINFATSVSYDIDLLPASGGENTSSEPLSVFLLTGDVYGKTVRLNGKTLRVEGGYVPEIDPHRIDGPLRMPPASIAFVRGAWDVPACQRMTMS